MVEPNKESSNLPDSKQASRLGKLVQGILQLFGRQEKPIASFHLIEVSKLRDSAVKINNKLKAIKDSLEPHVDEELFFYIKSIVITLDQDISNIHEIVAGKLDLPQQVKAYDLYAHWVADARPWIQLLSKRYEEREMVIRMATGYISAARIERDIRSLRNYPSVELAEKYRAQLEVALVMPLKKLRGLKYQPEDLSLEELQLWKLEVDCCRAEYYNEALKVIDHVTSAHE